MARRAAERGKPAAVRGTPPNGPQASERERIRSLAARYAELAADPVMQERRRLWTALKDLCPVRPMVLFETWTLEDYVTEAELKCEDPFWRNVERHLLWSTRHAGEVGDDLVLPPEWRVGWRVEGCSYGVEITARHAEDVQGGHVGYSFDHPLRDPADLERLRPRTWRVDRDATRETAGRLADCFGDLLPVVIHGTTALHGGLTGDLFRLIGNDRLLLWPYDCPDAIRRAMAYLRDDRVAYYRFLETEGLLGANANETLVGSGSPGFCSSLPGPAPPEGVRLQHLWLWMESQETVGISPRMFEELFLPSMADVCRPFGLIYYGCCEPVHDRWDRIVKAIPNVRAVSISPWCDMERMAEALGRRVVFSRKPRPAPISGPRPAWDELEADARATLRAARDGCLEIIFRDVYRIHGERPRLSRWVQMVRGLMGA